MSLLAAEDRSVQVEAGQDEPRIGAWNAVENNRDSPKKALISGITGQVRIRTSGSRLPINLWVPI